VATGAIDALGGAAVLLPLWIWWSVWRGGEPASVWLGALPLLACAALLLARFRAAVVPSGALRWSLVGGAGLLLWSACSMLWAADSGAALQATEQFALYLAAFAIVTFWPPTIDGLRLLVLAWVAVTLIAALAVLASSGGLIDGRLAIPTGYPNATAALFAMGALAALALGSSRGSRLALGAAASALLLGLSLLAQSRGAAIVLCAAFALAVALSAARWRLLRTGAAAALALFAFSGPLLSVRTEALKAAHPALHHRGALLIAGLLAGALAIALRRLSWPQLRWTRRSRWAVALVVAALTVGGALAASATLASDAARLGSANYARLELGSSRYTGDLGSYRPDYWRVALSGGASHPLLGAGAGGFAGLYLQDRRTTKAPQHAHSVWLETFAELGVPGLLMLLAFAGCLCTALAAALRRTAAPQRDVLLAAALPGAFLAMHASVDWVASFPVLAVPAIGLAAAAASAHAGRPVNRGNGRWVRVALAALGVSALVAIPLLVSTRLTDHALASWARHPGAAISELRLAEQFDPLSARPPLALGVVALEVRRPAVAVGALREAVRRNPEDWFARYALGLLAAADGQRAAARRLLGRALARNPREPLIAAALRAPGLDPLAGLRAALAEHG
jgi:tetratricopeptide (TPR) repeat protein